MASSFAHFDGSHTENPPKDLTNEALTNVLEAFVDELNAKLKKR